MEPQLNIALDHLEDQYGLNPPEDAIADAFIDWAESTGRPLYPHQEDALLASLAGEHLIVATPTGSGKSMIALIAIFNALAHGQTAYYTAPLKALVSEKFFELVKVLGADNVGMVTGDASINGGAPVICATAEIVANMALREGSSADIGTLVQDEFHFYGDPQRGWAWQVPLLELTNTTQVLLSATLGDTSFLQRDLKERTGRDVALIESAERPVPLDFKYSYKPTGELLHELVHSGHAPVYVVHFSQRAAVETAQTLQSFALVTKEQKEAIREAIGDFRFSAGFGKILSKLLRQGIGVHHAGLLPRYRRLVERLAQRGLLPVICGTDTLGVGINVPIRTVLMTSLVKFDGTKRRRISAREFHQIAGRAGRAGFDTEGTVVVQAPEFEIENARMEENALARAGGDPAKKKRVQKKKAPEGEVLWSEKTFRDLQTAQPETLTSHLRITHSMVLNMLQRDGDSVAALFELLRDNHEPRRESNPLLRRAIEIYNSLHRAGVVVHMDMKWHRTHPDQSVIQFAREVPEDFALNSPLAPFALAALDLLDKDSDTYALDVISVMEAVQENPTQVLKAQERKARGNLIGQLEAAGVGYEERMAEADAVSWPKPLEELLTGALEIYRQTNPWVDDYVLTPKSVVREMIERVQTFSEFISSLDLQRSEGVVLRYLTDVYKALRQTVPLEARTDELEDMTEWLGALIRSVDSSLLDEWEAMRDGQISEAEARELSAELGADVDATASAVTPTIPGSSTSVTAASTTGAAGLGSGGSQELAFGADADGHVDFSRNRYAMRRSLAAVMFKRILAIQFEDYDYLDETAGAPLWAGATTWNGDAWEEVTAAYFDTYEAIGTDTHARSADFLRVNPAPDTADFVRAGVPDGIAEEWAASGRYWLARQVFDDGAGDGSWGYWARVDLDASSQQGRAVTSVISVGEL